MNGGKELKWANAPALEQKILADIYTKTGWAFGRVGGIRTGDPFIAHRVLSILVDWYPLMEDPGYRAEIACRFHYATAHAFLHIVLDWWQRETDRVPREYLTQVVAELTQAEDAELVWGVFQQVPRDPFSVFILQKLARYKPTSQAARDEAVRMLQEGPPGYGPLEAISHIDDVRVRRWFREHSNDADPGIKKLASRLLKRGKALLLELTRSIDGPDRITEFYSFEGDIRDIETFCDDVERRFKVKVPSWFRKARFLDQLERDEWVFVDLLRRKEEPISIWVRLEDLDVVELVVTPIARQPEKMLPN